MNQTIKDIISQTELFVRDIAQEKFSTLNNKNITQKKDGSFVTDFDTAIDDALVKKLQLEFPDIAFISEESQSDTSDIQGLAWCIDPIDGTHNFMMDISYYAVSVGLLENGNPIAGIIYNPILDEIITGGLDVPVTYNQSVLNVKNSSYVVTTNRSHSLIDKERELEYIQKIGKSNVLKYRRLGSCALDIMNIVLGRIGGVYIVGNSKWDWAAGYAIAQALGVKITRDDDVIIMNTAHLDEHMVK